MVSRKYVKFAILGLLFALSLSATASERVALIIANADYQDAIDVQGAGSGVAALERVLSDRFGFDVETELGSNRYYTQKAISEFRNAAENAEIALLYYAGHSIVLSGRPYLVPTDASLRSRRDLRKLIDVNSVGRPLGAAQNLVFVMDVCWEELLAEGWGDRFGRRRLCEATESIDGLGTIGRLVVFTDTTPDAASGRKSRRQSYAAQLASVLKDSSGGEALEATLKRVAKSMARSGNDPRTFGSLGNRVNLAPVEKNNNRNVEIADQPPPVDNAPARTDKANEPQDTAGFYVDSQPANAVIQILNIRPRYFPGIQLDVGESYQIRVQADGYSPLTRWVRFLPDGEEMRIQLELEAISPQQSVPADIASIGRTESTGEGSGRRVVHVSERDVSATGSGYIFEADISGEPRAVRLFFRFGGLRYEKAEMALRSGRYAATLDASVVPAHGTVEYFVFAEYAIGENQSAGSANSPLALDVSRLAGSQGAQITAGRPPEAAGRSSDTAASTNREVTRSAVRGGISFSDMQVVVSRFNAFKNSIEAKDGAALERLAAESDGRDQLLSMTNDFESFDLELLNVRSSEKQGTISADLKINSYRRADGSMVVPSPRNNVVSLTSWRVSGSGARSERWSSLMVAR